jgi:hypothetical protein
LRRLPTQKPGWTERGESISLGAHYIWKFQIDNNFEIKEEQENQSFLTVSDGVCLPN